jgi:hypothetical protein
MVGAAAIPAAEIVRIVHRLGHSRFEANDHWLYLK